MSGGAFVRGGFCPGGLCPAPEVNKLIILEIAIYILV
jgi:hypothetical protein